MKLVLIGAGGHAKSVFDIVKKKKIYFCDNIKKKININDKNFVVHKDNLLFDKLKSDSFKLVIAIGDNQIRKKNYLFYKKQNFKFDTLIHSNSYRGFGSKIGEGTVLLHGSYLNTDTKVGKNCIINSNASIDHDCSIGDHTHICPGVVIAGNVKIGKNCWVGLGAKIIQNCIIGDNVFIAAGAVVTRNIKSNSFVKGIPAKYAKKLA